MNEQIERLRRASQTSLCEADVIASDLRVLLSALDEAVELLRPFARMAGNPATDNSAYARARDFIAKTGRK